MSASKLDQLRAMTVVVADTGDVEAIRRFAPEDATTNPSLILKTVESGAHDALVEQAARFGARQSSGNPVEHALDKLAVLIGAEIAKIVPGRVSTEAPAQLSFDRDATIAKAERLIELYEAIGVDRERILIKIAATWEGIEAARELQKRSIDTNLTLLFNFAQAVACAEAGVFLISPFVGRILDWHKAKEGRDFAPEEDPGVISVTRIYHYFKKFGHSTIVMGASFRNTGEIERLAGCDRLTIAPNLLEALDADAGALPRILEPTASASMDLEPVSFDEKAFRWALNQDPMATEKLAGGINAFHADYRKLEARLAPLLG